MNLKNTFLIAMPNLNDPFFHRSVIYLCEHNEQGSMGLVINQPTDLSVAELIAKMNFMIADKKNYAANNQWILAGGPVEAERGFILHTPSTKAFQQSQPITEQLYLTTSSDVLDSLTTAFKPEKYLIALGYAGWSAGQLEQEIKQNSWLIAPADPYILFDAPHQQRWQLAQQTIGFELHHLSHYAGNA